MNIMTVIAHPNPKSFSHAILRQFDAGLKEAGHTNDIVDLYAIRFDPEFKTRDFAGYRGGAGHPPAGYPFSVTRRPWSSTRPTSPKRPIKENSEKRWPISSIIGDSDIPASRRSSTSISMGLTFRLPR